MSEAGRWSHARYEWAVEFAKKRASKRKVVEPEMVPTTGGELSRAAMNLLEIAQQSVSPRSTGAVGRFIYLKLWALVYQIAARTLTKRSRPDQTGLQISVQLSGGVLS
jgi:hypothetical protein